MKIRKIEITNFRLLKDFKICLEDELSLIIGKNNIGKTSILSVIDKFLNQSDKNKFSFDDFNIDFKNYLEALIKDSIDIIEDNFKQLGITLKLFIEYNESDNLSNISRVMMDLDPENNFIVLGFEYVLGFDNYKKLKKEFKEFEIKEIRKKDKRETYLTRGFSDFLRQNHSDYFNINKKSFQFDKTTFQAKEDVFINLMKEEVSVKDIICFKYISARRNVSNKDADKTLSGLTSIIYKKTEANEEQNKAVEEFKDSLNETDCSLSDIYKSLFSEVIEKVKKFGGIKPNESEIEIVSTLQHRELLEGNTTVVYKCDDDNQLPENYNGLGYMNLISMIFEIKILIQEFKQDKSKKPADINLLFIEEPEAHTHPQMQYVFINNIKELLKEGIEREDGECRELQYIISTHSSCIVADCDFNDIKYLKREGKNCVIAKNLKDLEKEYIDNGQEENFRFLKQYVTISRAELFFADKAIFVEGDTERILLPAMMKKIDQDYPDNPLLSQNISIVEVGNYSNIFEKLINFVGLKSLIITDIDSVKKDYVRSKNGEIVTTKLGTFKMAYFSCLVIDGEKSSNPTLRFFFGNKNFNKLRTLTFNNKRFIKEENWVENPEGHLQIVYQIPENGYHARSFEDAFFCLQKNIEFVKLNKSRFRGLKNMTYFDDPTKTPFDLAESCIDSKGSFAVDILLFSSKNSFQDWQIPSYIKEGLLWLKQD